jgi:type IV secretory pathway VirB6-like protein
MFGTMSGTTSTAASSCSSAASNLPSLPTTLSDYCKAMLAGLAALMVFFLPIVAVFTTSIVLQYIMLFARAMLGYLTVMVLISFLFIISPLMFSFALFKATQQIFEQWIRYLTTFSLQLVLVFAFLAMLQLVLSPLTVFLTGTLGLIREYDVTWSKQYTSAPVHMCSICEYTPNPISIQGSVLSMTTFPVTCGGGAGTDGVPASGGSSDSVIPLGNLLQHNDLIVFLLSQTIALMLIFAVMKDFMQKAPELAQQLGGVPNAPSITGGTPDNPSNLNYPGLSGGEKTAKGWIDGLVGARPTPK